VLDRGEDVNSEGSSQCVGMVEVDRSSEGPRWRLEGHGLGEGDVKEDHEEEEDNNNPVHHSYSCCCMQGCGTDLHCLKLREVGDEHCCCHGSQLEDTP
jgi:hypothetical protein